MSLLQKIQTQNCKHNCESFKKHFCTILAACKMLVKLTPWSQNSKFKILQNEKQVMKPKREIEKMRTSKGFIMAFIRSIPKIIFIWWFLLPYNTPGVNFINVESKKKLYDRHFGSFYYIHVTGEKLPKQYSYKKFVLLTLMKLTPVWGGQLFLARDHIGNKFT